MYTKFGLHPDWDMAINAWLSVQAEVRYVGGTQYVVIKSETECFVSNNIQGQCLFTDMKSAKKINIADSLEEFISSISL